METFQRLSLAVAIVIMLFAAIQTAIAVYRLVAGL